MSEWYVIIDDNEMGPYDQSVLEQLAQEGELTGDHMVWSSGMPSWEQASSVPFLQQHVGGSNPLNVQKKSTGPNMKTQAPKPFTSNPNHAYGNLMKSKIKIIVALAVLIATFLVIIIFNKILSANKETNNIQEVKLLIQQGDYGAALEKIRILEMVESNKEKLREEISVKLFDSFNPLVAAGDWEEVGRKIDLLRSSPEFTDLIREEVVRALYPPAFVEIKGVPPPGPPEYTKVVYKGENKPHLFNIENMTNPVYPFLETSLEVRALSFYPYSVEVPPLIPGETLTIDIRLERLPVPTPTPRPTSTPRPPPTPSPKELLQRLAERNSHLITKPVLAMLEINKRGYSAEQYFTSDSVAVSLFAPTEWEILDTSILESKTAGFVRVLVDSTNKGGIPIRKIWQFTLIFTEEHREWRIAQVIDVNNN